MDENAIFLRLVENVTNKLDGTQSSTVRIFEAGTDRCLAHLAGVTVQTTPQGRILAIQISNFGHEVRESKEVVTEQAVSSSEQ